MHLGKNTDKGKRFRRCVAGGLAMILAILPVTAFGEEYTSGVAATCDEAYYAMLDYYGNLQEGSVVKSYVMNGANTITDYGNYDEVTNLTDGTEPTYENGVTTFRFKDGEAPDHFYFQGTTKEPYEVLPWKISLQYQLNGVKTEAEDLAGEKGVVTVELNIVPNEAASQYAKNNYVLMATTMFNQNDILSLKAEGAQVQLVGNLRTVIFAAMPGEERHYTMEVGTDSFEFMGFTFLVVPATLAQLDMISDLQKDKDGIEENFNKLKGSIDETLDAMESMAGPLRSSAAGLNELNSARAILSQNQDTIYSDVDRANADLQQFAVYIDPLYNDIEAASGMISDTRNSLQDLMDTTVSLKEDITAFQEILKKTKKDTEKARKSTKDARKDIETLQKDAKKMKSLINDIRGMRTTIKQLRSNLEKMSGIQTVDGISADTAQIKNLITAYDTLKNDENNARTYLDALYSAGAIGADGSIDVNTAFVMVLMQNIPGITQEQAVALATAYGAQDVETLTAMAAAFGMDLQTLSGALGQAYSGAQTMAGQLAPLAGVYMANGGPKAGFDSMSFKTFTKNILKAQGSSEKSAEQNASMLDLVYTYTKNGDDIAAADRLIAEMGGAVTGINGSIGEVNKEIDAIKGPSTALLKDAEDVLEGMSILNTMIDDLDAIGDGASDSTKDIDEVLDHLDESIDQVDASLNKGNSLIDQLDATYKTINDYEPTLQKTLKNLQSITAHASASIRDLSTLISDTEAVAKKAGGPLDSGTEKTLGGLSVTLVKTADALDTVKNIRSAKETLTGIIEDAWKEHTGEMDNLLNMDSKAAPQSLTSSQNETPTSIQYMIRSQEIKIDDSGKKEVEEEALKSKTFFGRVGTMFHDIGSAFTNAFK